MTADTPTPPLDTKRPSRIPWCLIGCAAAAILAVALLAGFYPIIVMLYQDSEAAPQSIADDPSRILNVLPGMTVQGVRNALGCPNAADIPTRWHPRHHGFAAEALADIRGKRQLLYYEWAMPDRPGYRRAYVIFGGDMAVSEVRVFDLEIGMTRDAVIRRFGLPLSSSSGTVKDSLAYTGFEGGTERPGGVLHTVEVHFNSAGIVDTISIARSRADD